MRTNVLLQLDAIVLELDNLHTKAQRVRGVYFRRHAVYFSLNARDV